MSSKLSIAGDRIAHPTADGRVAIWDVANAKLQSEFVPPGHLGATTRVVEWIAENIIAYGTSAGRVHFLDADRNVRIGQELAGHSGDVLALVVHPIDSSLFSGSRDGHVVRWKVDKDSWSGIVDKKWKADKRPVSALSISGHGRYLISGSSQSIKLWSFPDFALVRTLNGHVSAITSLIAFDLSPPRPPTASASKKKRKSMNKHPYLVSSADGDRSVCVWNIRDVEDTESTTLSCSADVVQISVSVDANGFALIAAVTAKGTLHLFRSKFVEHRTDKPLEPTKTIRFVAPGRNGERNTIPVLHAHVFTGSRVMVVRDDWAKPAIESLEFDTLSENNVLEREKSKIRSKSVAPEMATTVRTPVPNPQTAYTTGTVSAQKRGRETRNVVEKSLGERLDAMDKAKAKVPPDSGQSQKHLLIQGLESKDKAILDQVLNLENPATIKGTVRRLPVAYVHSLLDELTRRLSGRLNPQIALVHIRWVHSVLNEHTAYLASSPQADNLLRPLIAIREEGETLLRRMSELKGRFDMMMNKLSSTPEDFRDDDRDTQVFRDDSDEELGFGVPTSADDDELWETASEPAAAEDEEDEDEEDEASDESEMEVDSDEDG